MAVNNKPQDDAAAMYEEYQTGKPINDIAEKYNHTPAEVEEVVTNIVPKTNDKKSK